MPLFDWSQPSISQVTTRYLWIYWAVTGPLTLIVMASVIALALWHNRQGTETAGDEVQETNERRELGREAKTVGISTSHQAIHNKNFLRHILKRQHHYSDSEP